MPGFSYFGGTYGGGWVYVYSSGPRSSGLVTAVESKPGIYTRYGLLGQIAGANRLQSSAPNRDRVRRIWPDEPNVGFVEERMAFLVDGALKIGGPSLKTYDLNGDSALSWPRETRLYHDDTYGKLRGSENEAAVVDVFNCVGSWYSTTSPGVGAAVSWATEVVSDSSAYQLSSGNVSILRPGVYCIAYRSWASPDGSAVLRVTLDAGGNSWLWEANGLGGDITIADVVVYSKSDTASSSVSLTLTAGSALGDAGSRKSVLTILKMR